jgi:hypothetical protein
MVEFLEETIWDSSVPRVMISVVSGLISAGMIIHCRTAYFMFSAIDQFANVGSHRFVIKPHDVVVSESITTVCAVLEFGSWLSAVNKPSAED